MADSTLDDVTTASVNRGALAGRRFSVGVLTLIVVAGALGVLGVHSVTRTASGEDYRLSVRYAEVARAGLDVPLKVTVTHPGGFGAQLVIAITAGYFDIFETQGFTPNPSAATRDDTTLYLTFDAPKEGDVFTFSYDAYIQPASQQGHSATIAVVDNGTRVVSTDITTRLLP